MPSKRNLEFKDYHYLQHPKQQKFYRFLALLMGTIALNTEYWPWYRKPRFLIYDIQRWLIIIFVPVISVSQSLYLYVHYHEHDFDTLSAMFAMIPINLAILVKSLSARTSHYKKATTDFMDKIHLYNFLKKDYSERKRNFIIQELIKAEKYTRLTFGLWLSSVLFSCCAWNVVPIVHNIRNNDSIHNITHRLELTMHILQPIGYEFNFYKYILMLIFGLYCTFVGTTILATFDGINLAFIYQLIGHIEIIKYDLRTDFTEKHLNDNELKRRLVNITTSYYFKTKTFKDIEAAFGLNIASIYAQNLVQGGLMIYHLMSSGSNPEILLTYGLMIPLFMGILIGVSFILENIRIIADDIPSLVYDIPWESMSMSNQKMVLIILCQVQPTLEFKAAFNIKTGVQPALSIIKATFSYYVMIKSKDEQ